MKGVVWQGSSRFPVQATVTAWQLTAEPSRPLAIAGTGRRGEFDLDLRGKLIDDEDIVLRVYFGAWRPDSTSLIAVVQLPISAQDASRQILIAPPPDGTRTLFLKAVDESGAALNAVQVTVVDLTRLREPSQRPIAYGGWFTVDCPVRPGPVPLRFWSGAGDEMVVAEHSFDADEVETVLSFSPAGAFKVRGGVRRTDDGSPVPDVRVELLDRTGAWAAPVATGVTDKGGSFALSFGRALATPPDPSFAIWYGDERLAVVDWPNPWRDGLLDDVSLTLTVDPGQPLTYRLDGQVLARDTRAGVPDVQAELWDQSRILRIATTDAAGRFTATLRATANDGPPAIDIRILQTGNLLGAQHVPPTAWIDGATTVFIEVDVPRAAPTSFLLAGRLLHNVTHEGIGGLRIEAWDKAPRVGGTIGAATYAADDGTFNLVLPPGPVPGIPPSLYFRLYYADAVVPAADPVVTWDDTGLGSTVIEIAGTPTTENSDVALHELGETIADAVHRMRNELVRYPSELGAYLVDELDLSVPVAVQLDRLGQVRARVVDRAPADEQLGHFRLRVRPVTGVQAPLSEQLDQPLSILPELSAAALAELAALRIYSVEDLARLAQTAAGWQALATLGLGVDLNKLLEKVALLAVRVLPRPIRDALVRLGFGGLQAFVDAEPAELATQLTTEVGQPITVDAVALWQASVLSLLHIPLPIAES